MRKVVQIRNLDCANCERELSEELLEVDGIEEANADFIHQKVTLAYSTQEAFERAVDLISHFEKVEIIDGNAPVKKDRKWKELCSVLVSLALFVPALVLWIVGENEWISFALFLSSAVAAGWQVVYSAVKNIFRAFKSKRLSALLDENLLMLIASVGAFVIGQSMEGAAVLLLYQVGEYLQSLAVGSSRNAIQTLAALKSGSAILLNGKTQTEVAPEELCVGDTVLLRKGDKVAADCRVLEGSTHVDTKSLTGESDLREVGVGAELLSGYVVCGNAVKAEVLRKSDESAVAKILEMVENATQNKAKPEKFITRFARYYTPIVVLLALAVAIVPPLFDGYNFARWVRSALNFLVISCPCALMISVPLTYFSGVGALARAGVLCKGAVYLDVLCSTRVAAFDKTGTLTEGKFTVSSVKGEERALLLAAAVERASSHPLAQAFASIETPYRAECVQEIAGRGLSAVIDGKKVLVGSAKFLQENGIVRTEEEGICVAEEGAFVGSVAVCDRIKEGAGQAIESLKRAGIAKTVVLTGDGKRHAEEALEGIPVDEIYADLLPAQKLECAKRLKEEGGLLYAGDGINDTPVMAESDVSFAMGGLGSDAAIETGDFVLITDSLDCIPKTMRVAKKTRKIVFENIVFSIAVKIALMGISLFGIVPLWLAVFGDVGVMLLAVLNSMRMRRKIK